MLNISFHRDHSKYSDKFCGLGDFGIGTLTDNLLVINVEWHNPILYWRQYFQMLLDVAEIDASPLFVRKDFSPYFNSYYLKLIRKRIFLEIYISFIFTWKEHILIILMLTSSWPGNATLRVSVISCTWTHAAYWRWSQWRRVGMLFSKWSWGLL